MPTEQPGTTSLLAWVFSPFVCQSSSNNVCFLIILIIKKKEAIIAGSKGKLQKSKRNDCQISAKSESRSKCRSFPCQHPSPSFARRCVGRWNVRLIGVRRLRSQGQTPNPTPGPSGLLLAFLTDTSCAGPRHRNVPALWNDRQVD